MSKTPGPFATALCLMTAVPKVSLADGVSAIFTPDGRFIDTIEIIGDVTIPSGETYAVLEMNTQHMRFYVDPDAIYVMMEQDNPVLTEQTPFRGFWLDQRTIDNTSWPACQTSAFDEFGAAYQAHGNLVWVNSGIAENGYELEFYIQLGTCDDKPQDWGVSRPETGDMGQIADPNEQSAEAPSFILTDANGTDFSAYIREGATTLEALRAGESLLIYGNCTAYAEQHGEGTWGWANGGFVIDFNNASFSFPRMDPPIENGGACRL